AFNQNGESSPSAEFQSAVTSIPALQAVVLDKTDTTLTLAADQIVKNLDQGQSALQFELMTFGGETGATSIFQSDWVQTSSYQFTGLAPSTVFQGRIRARSQAGEQTDWGAFSEPISLEEAQVAILSVSLNVTDQNGVSLNTDPVTTEERVFVRITTANI